MSVYDSWVHGHSVLLERVGSPSVTNKASVKRALKNQGVDVNETGDIIHLGAHGAVACFRVGWASRFVVFDSGSKDKPKSGSFWCHFAIPTQIVPGLEPTQARQLFVNYETSNTRTLNIKRAHVWDGNRRIFADNQFVAPRLGSNAGISGRTTSRNRIPIKVPTRLYTRTLVPTPIFFGVGISLLITAQAAKGHFLEIRGLGLRFEYPDG